MIGIFNKYKIHLKNIIFSMISYIALLIYFDFLFSSYSYDVLITLVYFLILLFYYKVKMVEDKRVKAFSYTLSLIISSLLAVGSTVYPVVYNGAVSVFNIKNTLSTIICILGLFLILSRLFSLMFKNINKLKIFEEERSDKKLGLFFIILFAILVCWIPYFLRFYPAIMTPDSYYVIYYSNFKVLSDFHTFGHTWFFGIFFLLGKYLFSNMNMAVSFSIIIQMIILALIFSYAIIYLYKKGLKKSIMVFITAIYALSPLHAHYSITLWRDILFGGAFVLLFIALLKMISINKKFNKSAIFLLIVSLLFIMFFRNNGIYICILLLPFLLLSKFNGKKIIIPIYVFMLVLYFIVKGPIFDYFNVQKTTTTEAFSIPLQQITRVIAIGKDIDEETKEYISGIMDYDLISEKYKSATSDPIKTLTNNEELSKSKGEFFKVWFKNLFKYPKVYIEAYLTETLGYWYPNVQYWATGGESKSFFEDIDVQSDPITSEKFNYIIDTTTSRKLPFCNFIWSIGTTTFILIISTFIFAYKKNFKYLICYMPLYLLLLSILLSTPVFCELRYVYGMFTCVPLLLTVPFMKLKED